MITVPPMPQSGDSADSVVIWAYSFCRYFGTEIDTALNVAQAWGYFWEHREVASEL